MRNLYLLEAYQNANFTLENADYFVRSLLICSNKFNVRHLIEIVDAIFVKFPNCSNLLITCQPVGKAMEKSLSECFDDDDEIIRSTETNDNQEVQKRSELVSLARQSSCTFNTFRDRFLTLYASSFKNRCNIDLNGQFT